MPSAAPVPVVIAPTGPARQDFGVSAEAFPPCAVTLLPGPLLDKTSRSHSYLRFLDPDRLLHTLRRNVGLPSGVVPCGGWEKPDSELRGHLTGRLLSALAHAYASTGDRAFSVRADYLVQQLALCQDRARIAGFSTGYLSAFPEGFIGRVEARQPVRAPYDTLHRIMAGLLDTHLLVGNRQALHVLTRMASWVGWRAGRLTEAHRQDVLATGFGGMNEVLANLYQVTGDPAHLAAARFFDHAEVFDALALGADAAAGRHANSAKVLGAIRAHHATGTARYRDIAVNFWEAVSAHTAAIGSELPGRACECRDLHHMLELTRQLFRTDPQARYFDYYEKALGLLGALDPDPRRSGGIRDGYDFTCCHGTGMEIHTRHGDSIYFHAGNTLYVNLFIPSVLSWAGRGVSVRQDTTFPESAATRLTVTGSGRIDLRVRVPSWACGARLLVNGVAQSAVVPGTYARVDRHWVSGDVVELSLSTSRPAKTPVEFTAAAWVRLDTLATGARIFDFGDSHLCLTAPSPGYLRYAITAGGVEHRIDAGPLPVGSWTHVAVTQTAELGVLYVNGVEVARNSALISPFVLGGTVGRSRSAASSNVDAEVEDLRMHDRALTPSEVADLHLRDVSVPIRQVSRQ